MALDLDLVWALESCLAVDDIYLVASAEIGDAFRELVYDTFLPYL